MDKKLKSYLVKSIIILVLIHIGYFLYGYFKFEGIGSIDAYTEFYRFKFYDDVSISQFFITGLFLLFFLIFLVKNHARQNYAVANLLKIGAVLLLISFLSFSFFVSYSFGMNAKMRGELSERKLNANKELLNVLRPFLYSEQEYNSPELFDPLYILYPKPYPVILETDSTAYGDGYYATEDIYYSIDTLKMLTENYNKISTVANEVLDSLGFGKQELLDRVIAKNVRNDSTELIYKGQQVNPTYDPDICIFVMNKALYQPINGRGLEQQQYAAAVQRYHLLYKHSPDSLLSSLQQLDTLFQAYNVESSIVPATLVKDIFTTKDNKRVEVTINNNFDRGRLREKLDALERLYYTPNFLHPSIAGLFFSVVIGAWLIGFLVYCLFNKKKEADAS